MMKDAFKKNGLVSEALLKLTCKDFMKLVTGNADWEAPHSPHETSCSFSKGSALIYPTLCALAKTAIDIPTDKNFLKPAEVTSVDPWNFDLITIREAVLIDAQTYRFKESDYISVSTDKTTEQTVIYLDGNVHHRMIPYLAEMQAAYKAAELHPVNPAFGTHDLILELQSIIAQRNLDHPFYAPWEHEPGWRVSRQHATRIDAAPSSFPDPHPGQKPELP